MTKTNQVDLTEIITDELDYMYSESKKGSIIFGRYYKKGPLCTSTLDLEVCKQQLVQQHCTASSTSSSPPSDRCVLLCHRVTQICKPLQAFFIIVMFIKTFVTIIVVSIRQDIQLQLHIIHMQALNVKIYKVRQTATFATMYLLLIATNENMSQDLST